MKQQQKQSQKILLNLAMKQAFHVLQLPTLELGLFLKQQIELNPMLEEIDEFEKPLPAFKPIEDKPSLYEHLMNQAKIQGFSPQELEMAQWIIGNLDEKGFFNESSSKFPKKIFQNVLKQVQGFDPLGIAARDLKESFLLQLQEVEMSLACKIVETCFEDLIQGKFEKIEKRFNCSKDQIIETISKLQTNPGTRFQKHEAQPITPDVIIEKEMILPNSEDLPHFKLKQDYVSLLESESINPEEKRFIRRYIAEGKWLFRTVQRRSDTLLRITRWIVEKQPAYFQGKETHPRALSLRELANDLNLHESTIARALSEKYLLCIHDLVPFKRFFSENEKAKELIKQMIASENRKKPYSDEVIAKKLTDLGIAVARRTVSKYRVSMNIPTSPIRKKG